MEDLTIRVLYETWSVLGEMAPYLLFGFLVAGILSVCVSPELVERHLGGRGFAPVWKAAILGVPLPLCSCGVIPVAASFRRHGASPAATTSFLLSTPQTGVDSIAVTYALLGWVFTIFRPLMALATGLFGGLLVMLFSQARTDQTTDVDKLQASPCTESCCVDRGKGNIVWRCLEYGFITLPRDIGIALLIGVVIAGAISALVPANELHKYLGGGLLSIVLAMLIGTPLYVCASASVPIAVGLIHMGASPGTALAFLIAGPATNAATIATLWKLLGRLSAGLYLATIVLSAILGGLLLDWIFSITGAPVPHMAEHLHGPMGGTWISTVWALLLLTVLAYSYWAKPKDEEHASEADHHHAATSSEDAFVLAIEGMTCSHCQKTVADALRRCPGVVSAHVDLAAGRATVHGDSLDAQSLLAAVKSAGYQATPVAKEPPMR